MLEVHIRPASYDDLPALIAALGQEHHFRYCLARQDTHRGVLLLALIDIPDFPGWLGRIARAVERIAGLKPDEAAVKAPARNVATGEMSAENATTVPDHTQGRSTKDEELIHA